MKIEILSGWTLKEWSEYVIKSQLKAEANFARDVIVPLFELQQNKVLEMLSDRLNVHALLLALHYTESTFAGHLYAEIVKLITERGQHVMDRLGVQAAFKVPETKAFDKTNVATRFARARAMDFAKDVNKTTEGALKQIVVNGIEKKEDYATIARKIQITYAQWTGEEDLTASRAMRIAPTEVHTAQEFATLEAFVESDVVDYKGWANLGDGHVRASHEFLNDEIVPIDETFSNGLLYPGMPGGEPSEVVNCRCSMYPAERPRGRR